MRIVKYANRFKRDYRREKSGQRGTQLDKILMGVVDMLAAEKPLPRHNFDHHLTGEWSDYRDCHIRPDLVLIYRKPDDTSLELVRLRSHSELGWYGYAHFSTYGQTLDAQLHQLRKAGCSTIYRGKVTGARADRLARSTFDLFAIVKQIVDAKGQFRSLAEPSADTVTSTGPLMIAVLGGLADVERDLIRTRTAEGRAKARGVRLGRRPKLTLHQQKEARRRAGGATLKELAKSYNVAVATISRPA
jgi:YafQ family addiction module toxin component